MLPLYDFDLRATHARTLLPAALASVSFGFVLVRVRVVHYFRYYRNPQQTSLIVARRFAFRFKAFDWSSSGRRTPRRWSEKGGFEHRHLVIKALQQGHQARRLCPVKSISNSTAEMRMADHVSSHILCFPVC